MVSDQQVKRLWRWAPKLSLEVAAAKAGMDSKTARKYLRARRLPSEMQQKHSWRTRPDPFADVWDEMEQRLRVDPGLQAKTLFEYLQEREPGRFGEGQLRTLQRRMKQWRALEGPPREVFFAQDHYPGQLCQSDFTHCRELGVTINGQAFPHLIYHFVLSYSNWETGTICYSETFESLSEGLQNALWELGGVPNEHRSDRMSAAVNNLSDTREFTRAYDGLLRVYGLSGQKIQAGEAHENGDIEQRHYRFKQAVDQALMMRGSRDFNCVTAYDQFLRKQFARHCQLELVGSCGVVDQQYRGYRFSKEIIAHAVWLYFRFGVSFRDVEDMMAARGVFVTYETVRRWCDKFGKQFADDIRRRRARTGDRWHLDEVFLKINGATHYLWRAVDQNGVVLDILVQPKRDRFAAMRFFRRLLLAAGRGPRVIVTDKLRSYAAAKRFVMPRVAHRQHRYLNNRAENSHQPTRERERRMRRFKSAEHAQRFLEVHGIVASHFRPRRHLLKAEEYRRLRQQRFHLWNEVTSTATLG